MVSLKLKKPQLLPFPFFPFNIMTTSDTPSKISLKKNGPLKQGSRNYAAWPKYKNY